MLSIYKKLSLTGAQNTLRPSALRPARGQLRLNGHPRECHRLRRGSHRRRQGTLFNALVIYITKSKIPLMPSQSSTMNYAFMKSWVRFPTRHWTLNNHIKQDEGFVEVDHEEDLLPVPKPRLPFQEMYDADEEEVLLDKASWGNVTFRHMCPNSMCSCSALQGVEQFVNHIFGVISFKLTTNCQFNTNTSYE